MSNKKSEKLKMLEAELSNAKREYYFLKECIEKKVENYVVVQTSSRNPSEPYIFKGDDVEEAIYAIIKRRLFRVSEMIRRLNYDIKLYNEL